MFVFGQDRVGSHPGWFPVNRRVVHRITISYLSIQSEVSDETRDKTRDGRTDRPNNRGRGREVRDTTKGNERTGQPAGEGKLSICLVNPRTRTTLSFPLLPRALSKSTSRSHWRRGLAWLNCLSLSQYVPVQYEYFTTQTRPVRRAVCPLRHQDYPLRASQAAVQSWGIPGSPHSPSHQPAKVPFTTGAVVWGSPSQVPKSHRLQGQVRYLETSHFAGCCRGSASQVANQPGPSPCSPCLTPPMSRLVPLLSSSCHPLSLVSGLLSRSRFSCPALPYASVRCRLLCCCPPGGATRYLKVRAQAGQQGACEEEGWRHPPPPAPVTQTNQLPHRQSLSVFQDVRRLPRPSFTPGRLVFTRPPRSAFPNLSLRLLASPCN